jgi:hypothetical protein
MRCLMILCEGTDLMSEHCLARLENEDINAVISLAGVEQKICRISKAKQMATHAGKRGNRSENIKR